MPWILGCPAGPWKKNRRRPWICFVATCRGRGGERWIWKGNSPKRRKAGQNDGRLIRSCPQGSPGLGKPTAIAASRRHWRKEGSFQTYFQLGPTATADQLIGNYAGCPTADDRVLIVGHQPTFGIPLSRMLPIEKKPEHPEGAHYGGVGPVEAVRNPFASRAAIAATSYPDA